MRKCFIIQPFDNGKYDRQYQEIIVPAVQKSGLHPYRVDEDASSTVLIESIERNIEESAACIADITENNPAA
ncbi:hypothetical protein [Inquilinus sp. OTU3971]|uniref:hypothetical protein n=1 Tax=Inquilinus sp. OTU3971 TaxID=3043855 RepID=UPI00313E9C2F